MTTYAIIPAAGKGKRSGFSAPKQFLKFNGKELIVYTLEIFQKNKFIDEIIIAADKAYINRLFNIKKKYRLSKVFRIIEGGKERQDSVYNALSSIRADKHDLIAVHDAARPMLPQDVLTNAVKTAVKKGNALVCIKAKDTLIKGTNIVKSYVDREEIYYVQTPQIFRYGQLMRAMEKSEEDNFTGTDESVLMQRAGFKINLVEGSVINFKITTKSDIEIFKKIHQKL